MNDKFDEIHQFIKEYSEKISKNPQSLGSEFQKILNENLFGLYEEDPIKESNIPKNIMIKIINEIDKSMLLGAAYDCISEEGKIKFQNKLELIIKTEIENHNLK